jgi:TolB-like protein
MIGTPAYMSPEQLSGDSELSGPSDVYSLGCVVYEMLAGQPPFTGTAGGAIIAKHLREPPPLRALRPEVPVSIERAIARALSRAPAERFQSAGEFMEALTGVDGLLAPPPLAARLPRVRARSLAMIGAVLVALAAAATFVTRRERPPIVAPAAAIAVFPFVPAVADTALTRLGRELVITLSSSLEGVGGIRTVDALTVLANVRATDAPATLADAVGLARRVGASSVVYGSVMRAGDIVRIDLSLHPTSGPAPLARASVTGLQNDIAALTDSAAWGLLREVWQRTDPPTPSLAAITTRSLPALRAFLHGERLIVDGQWRAAADAFQGAFIADSTFWLAYWRYALAQDFNALPVDPAIRAKYRAHRKEFPERDRLLIDAGLTDSLSEHFELVKAITVRFPDYWPGWWALSEHLAHTGPLLGTSESDLRVALERTVALNPRMVSAWDHLFWVAMWQRDTVLSGRVLRELTALRYDSSSRQETGSDALAFMRYIDALARGGGVTRDTAVTEPLFRLRESLVGTIDPDAFALGASFYGFPRGQVELTRALTARGEPTGLATASRLALVIALAERGAWDSALVAMDQLVAGTSDPMWPLYRYRLAVVGAWLGAVDPMIATGRRAAAAHVGAHLQPESRAELAWLDGLFAVVRNDAGALAAASGSVEGTDSVTAPFLGRSLRAFSIALAGDRARAADSLVKLERERAEFGWSRWRSDPHPFLTAVNRLAAASWLVERGDAGAAAPLLTWHQAVLFPMGHTAHANVIVQPHAYLEQARVAEALGQYDLARTYYRRFLWLYDAPVEAHRHLVRRAHEAVARLARQ